MKTYSANKKPQSVDEYIAQADLTVRARLSAIREVIKKTVPGALEKISYGMPYFGYEGRLVYFAAFKHHIGLYIPSPITEEFKKELKGYKTAVAAIRFPHDKKLPIPLIKKLVARRARINEEKS